MNINKEQELTKLNDNLLEKKEEEMLLLNKQNNEDNNIQITDKVVEKKKEEPLYNKELLDEYDTEYTYLGMLWKITKFVLSLYSAAILFIIRTSLMFVFSRSAGSDNLSALAAILPIYGIVTTCFASLTSQGYGFRAAFFAGAKEFRNLGLITNKAMLFNFFVGMFWFLFLFCFGQLIFKGTASNEQVYDDIGVLFRLISISTPFQYFQLVTNRFFLIVNYPLPIIIGAIIGIVVEVVFMCIFCLGMGWISGGIALSYSLSQISVVVFNMTMYLFFNPCKESIIAFNFKETFDGMWEYIKFSLKVGPILFFNMIVVITIAYIALIVSSEASSVFIVFQTFSTMMYIFGTCTSQANNIEINRALGRKKLKPLWKIFLASLTVDGLFLVLAVVLTSTLYSKIMSAYTTETDILMGLESIKVYLISNIVICVTISVFSEGLSSLNHVLFPTINLFLSRFVIFIGLSIILAKTTDLGLISIALSFTIGSAVNLLANSIKMIFVLKEYYNQGAELEKIEKK